MRGWCLSRGAAAAFFAKATLGFRSPQDARRKRLRQERRRKCASYMRPPLNWMGTGVARPASSCEKR